MGKADPDGSSATRGTVCVLRLLKDMKVRCAEAYRIAADGHLHM